MDAPDSGLCVRCRFVLHQHNSRGSSFLRCSLADRDPAYRRYPPLPVLECSGFEPKSTSEPPGPSGPRVR